MIKERLPGIRQNYKNGYGVSIISDGYGSEKGLLELAVMHHGELCYSTPITSDVAGWITLERAAELAKKVRELPEAEWCNHLAPGYIAPGVELTNERAVQWKMWNDEHPDACNCISPCDHAPWRDMDDLYPINQP